jgi:penicillin amidase
MFKRILTHKRTYLFLLAIGFLWFAHTQIIESYSAADLLSYSHGVSSMQVPENQGGDLEYESPDDKIKLEVAIDQNGIPHIFGDNAESTSFGLGMMHARDRYFQMDMIVRRAKGELAAVYGEPGLSSDLFWLAYEFEAKAKEMLESYKVSHPEVYKQLVAYAQGVNYYLDNQAKKMKPVEYKMFGTTPQKWEPHFSFLVHKVLCHELTGSDPHIERDQLLRNLPEELRIALYGSKIIDDLYGISGTEFSVFEKATDSLKLPANSTGYHEEGSVIDYDEMLSQKAIGSNAWVVHGNNTESGKVLLANDTHMRLELPGNWYEAELNAGEYHTAGFTIPGVPFVVIGRNKNIGWGVTNAHWDVIDRVSLEYNPSNEQQYKAASGWEDVKTINKTVHVKGKADTTITFFYTQNAMVISQNGQTATRWYPSNNDASLVTFYDLQRAAEWSEFLNAMRNYSYPAQNFLYGDVKGNIGYLAAGDMPLRPQGFDGGLVAYENYIESNSIPFEKLPVSYNPDNGYFFSANAEPAKTDYYLHYNWAEKGRTKRLKSELEKGKHSLESTQQLQSDLFDVNSQEFIKLISTLTGLSEEEKVVIEAMKSWDGITSREQKAPFYYHYFKYSLKENVFKRLQQRYDVYWWPQYENLLKYLQESSDKSWYDSGAVSSDQILHQALDTCIHYLNLDFGDDYANLTYGDYKNRDIQHFAHVPGGNAPIEVGGNEDCINVNIKSFGPSMRMILEIGDDIKCYSVIAGGQSGRPNSKLYSNQFSEWESGAYHEMQYVDAANAIEDVKQLITIK